MTTDLEGRGKAADVTVMLWGGAGPQEQWVLMHVVADRLACLVLGQELVQLQGEGHTLPRKSPTSSKLEVVKDVGSIFYFLLFMPSFLFQLPVRLTYPYFRLNIRCRDNSLALMLPLTLTAT